MKKPGILEVLLFFYVLSVILLSFKEGLFIFSNLLGFALVFAIILQKLIKENFGQIHFTIFHFIFFIFVFICAIGILSTPDSYKRLFSIFQILLLSIIITDIVVTNKSIWPIKYGLITGATICCALLPSQLKDVESAAGAIRSGSILGNPNLFSLTLILGIIFLFYELITPQKRFNKLYKTLCVALILLFSYDIVYYTGSRKGFFLLFVINIFFFSYFFFRSNLKGKIWIIMGFPVLQFVFGWFVLRSDHFKRVQNILIYFRGGNIAEGSLTTRASMLERAMELWREKPLFGWGIDQFRVVSGFNKYSHNNFSEIIVNNGIVGFLIYYFIYILIFISALQIYRNGKKNISFWILLVASLMLVNDFGMVSYYSKLYWILFSTIFGLIKIQQNYQMAEAV